MPLLGESSDLVSPTILPSAPKSLIKQDKDTGHQYWTATIRTVYQVFFITANFAFLYFFLNRDIEKYEQMWLRKKSCR